MCMPARWRALLVEPSAPPPNIALLAPEDNQSNAKALEPTLRFERRINSARRRVRLALGRVGEMVARRPACAANRRFEPVQRIGARGNRRPGTGRLEAERSNVTRPAPAAAAGLTLVTR